MCGIILVNRKDRLPANKMVEKRYQDQKSRGKEGYGYIAINEKNEMTDWQRAQSEQEILVLLKEQKEPTILFHHRTPTSTPNLIEATHPIKVAHESLAYDYYVVHNGIISNAEKLKEDHEKLGFAYNTEVETLYRTKDTTYSVIDGKMFNDSEALAVELALVLDGKKDEIETTGSVAFSVLQLLKGEKKVKAIYYGRNWGNPLKEKIVKEFISVASEGDGDTVIPDKLNRIDMETGKLTEQDLKIGKYEYQSKYKADDKYMKDDDYYSRQYFGKEEEDIDVSPYETEYLYELLEDEDNLQERINKYNQFETDPEGYDELVEELTAIQAEIKRRQTALDKIDLKSINSDKSFQDVDNWRGRNLPLLG